MKAWFARLVAALQPSQVAVAGPAPAAGLVPAGGQVPARQGARPAPGSPIPPAAPLAAPADADLAFFAWLVQRPVDAQVLPGAREHQALLQLDRLVADTGAHGALLPRAAAVIPQLLASLRRESSSLARLLQQVSRDVTLVAEVVRMANSPYYRRAEVVVELEHAIRVLGVDGLRSAIARAVLKPLFEVRSGELVTRSADRLWEHTQRQAQLCAVLARSKGLDSFEGYLMGLVHNAAWSTVLRAMEGVAGEQPWGLGPAFVAELGLRRDRLFGVIAQRWQLTDNLTQTAADVARQGLASAASPQGQLLYMGNRLASLLCDEDTAGAEATAQELLGEADGPVLECYRAFALSREACPRVRMRVQCPAAGRDLQCR